MVLLPLLFLPGGWFDDEGGNHDKNEPGPGLPHDRKSNFLPGLEIFFSSLFMKNIAWQ